VEERVYMLEQNVAVAKMVKIVMGSMSYKEIARLDTLTLIYVLKRGCKAVFNIGEEEMRKRLEEEGYPSKRISLITKWHRWCHS